MSKSKDAEAERAVLGYLSNQNRPYSATDIFNNLHKQYGKTLVVKLLDSLSATGKIKSKTYGKQVVYVADQSKFPDVPEAEIQDMDLQIKQLGAKVSESTGNLRRTDSELKTLTQSLTTDELRLRLSTAVNDCERHRKKLGELKSNSNAVSPEERQAVLNQRMTMVKAWRKRKRMANDITGAILEGYPKTKKALYEEIGIETDEEYNVKPPEL